jgi:dipeptidyl aminopeptidase/acylaminoacyl peptidase
MSSVQMMRAAVSQSRLTDFIIGLILAMVPLCGFCEPLSPDALVKEVQFFPYEGIVPSPDGKWIAYETDDPTKSIRFDYESQRYTKSGYPMLASAAATNIWVTEVASGKSIQMNSAQGFSWSPSWSPDGTRLAFYSDRGGQAALWAWDRRTGAAKQISNVEIFFSWWKERPLWSEDGKTILTKVLPERMTLNQVLSLSPYYAALLNGDKKAEPAANTPSVNVYSFHKLQQATQATQAKAPDDSDTVDLSFYNALFLSDLARVDVANGNVTRLVKRVRPMWFSYSPDQKQIAYMTLEGVVPKTQQSKFGVRLYSLATGKITELAIGFMDPNNLNSGISFSPDGSHIAYCDTGKTAERAAYVIDVNTGAKVKVSDPIDKDSRTFTWGEALWDKSGTRLYLLDPEAGRLWEVAADGNKGREVVKIPGAHIKDIAADEAAGRYWSPDDGKTMYVRAHDNDTKKDAIYSVTLGSGEAKKLYEGDESMAMREAGALTGLPHGSALVYSSESASRAADIWTLDVSKGATRRLSNLNPQYESASMGRVRTIDFLSMRGERLHGALLLPGDYEEGKRYPMVVWIYGGDNGSDKVNRFAFGWGGAFNFQMLASRGYAILYPDIPLHPGTPVQDVVSAVIPAVNKVVELGIADPQRLALMGQSFGGYNTISLLTRTSIFKAAVATSAAPTDLFMAHSFFLNGSAPSEGYYEEGQGGMKGSPWEFKTRYWENSPFFFLDNVETPLMLEGGAADLISAQSGNVYNGLRRLGKDVEYLQYEGEGHVVQQPVNVIDFWNRRIAWLERYLTSDNPPNKPASAQ